MPISELSKLFQEGSYNQCLSTINDRSGLYNDKDSRSIEQMNTNLIHFFQATTLSEMKMHCSRYCLSLNTFFQSMYLEKCDPTYTCGLVYNALYMMNSLRMFSESDYQLLIVLRSLCFGHRWSCDTLTEIATTSSELILHLLKQRAFVHSAFFHGCIKLWLSQVAIYIRNESHTLSSSHNLSHMVNSLSILVVLLENDSYLVDVHWNARILRISQHLLNSSRYLQSTREVNKSEVSSSSYIREVQKIEQRFDGKSLSKLSRLNHDGVPLSSVSSPTTMTGLMLTEMYFENKLDQVVQSCRIAMQSCHPMCESMLFPFFIHVLMKQVLRSLSEFNAGGGVINRQYLNDTIQELIPLLTSALQSQQTNAKSNDKQGQTLIIHNRKTHDSYHLLEILNSQSDPRPELSVEHIQQILIFCYVTTKQCSRAFEMLEMNEKVEKSRMSVLQRVFLLMQVSFESLILASHDKNLLFEQWRDKIKVEIEILEQANSNSHDTLLCRALFEYLCGHYSEGAKQLTHILEESSMAPTTTNQMIVVNEQLLWNVLLVCSLKDSHSSHQQVKEITKKLIDSVNGMKHTTGSSEPMTLSHSLHHDMSSLELNSLNEYLPPSIPKSKGRESSDTVSDSFPQENPKKLSWNEFVSLYNCCLVQLIHNEPLSAVLMWVQAHKQPLTLSQTMIDAMIRENGNRMGIVDRMNVDTSQAHRKEFVQCALKLEQYLLKYWIEYRIKEEGFKQVVVASKYSRYW